ncbi:MAG: MOSC domain-containing protein [Pseudomonadota bacterium]
MRGAGRVDTAAVMETLAELQSRAAQPGLVVWIGLRPERKAPMRVVAQAELTEAGLEGDHRSRPGARAVSLIQAEHLPVIAACLGRARVGYVDLRRNVAISGLNLASLRGRSVRIGGALIRLTVPCSPCRRMEAALGHGGYNAMRGHGGVLAEVLSPGPIRTGDLVLPQPVEGARPEGT